MARRTAASGAVEVALADTIGVAVPNQVAALVACVTGLDLDALVADVDWFTGVIGRPLPGRVSMRGAFHRQRIFLKR